MSWLTDRNWFLLAVVLYGLSTVYALFLWRKGFQRYDRVCYLLLFVGAVFHTISMVQRGFSLSRCPVNNLYEAITFVAWTIVASYLVVGLWSKVRFLGAFASPLLFGMGVFALFPALDVRGPEPQFVHGLFTLHAALILLAYGGFGLSSVAGMMFLVLEHDLKVNKLRAILSKLPSISRLEAVVSRLLLAGFILLTGGLFVGAAWLELPEGTSYFGDAKVVWSIVVWLIYLVLLVLRWWFELSGRRLAWGSVASFAFILLTFWGTNLLSAIHHSA